MKKQILLIAYLLIVNGVIAKEISRQIEMTWELGYSAKADSKPRKWIPAKVPGAVQLDIAKAENYAPFYYAEHWKDYLWMEDNYYTYRSNFKKPEIPTGDKLYFISKGIDYQFEIYFNDEKILEQEGMFTPVNIDLQMVKLVLLYTIKILL